MARRERELFVVFQLFQMLFAHSLMRLSASVRNCADFARSPCDLWMVRLEFSAHVSGIVILKFYCIEHLIKIMLIHTKATKIS